MKTDYKINSPIPDYNNERDVIDPILSKKRMYLLRHKYRSINAPNLNVQYADLGDRFLASLIDFTIVFLALGILEAVLFTYNLTNSNYNIYRIIIWSATWILYNTLFECSIYQATIGKMIMKTKVIGLYGKRIGFLNSLFRSFIMIVSVLPFGLGVWYISTDTKKRSWHDLIAGTYVIKI